MKKYVASRRDVCAGQLLRTEHPNIQIIGFDLENLVPINPQDTGIKISVASSLVCRGMLFNVDDFNRANDLIYTTPVNYPISGLSKDEDSSFTIEHYVELNEILKYLKYGEDLTQRDLNKIYKTLICSNKWLQRNKNLFGYDSEQNMFSSENEILDFDTYKELNWISSIPCSKPSAVERGYPYIKKKSIF